jgi:hypothetical protein
MILKCFFFTRSAILRLDFDTVFPLRYSFQALPTFYRSGRFPSLSAIFFPVRLRSQFHLSNCPYMHSYRKGQSRPTAHIINTDACNTSPMLRYFFLCFNRRERNIAIEEGYRPDSLRFSIEHHILSYKVVEKSDGVIPKKEHAVV